MIEEVFISAITTPVNMSAESFCAAQYDISNGKTMDWGNPLPESLEIVGTVFKKNIG
jgi:hypothetical protein